jgi:hypothetical protein
MGLGCVAPTVIATGELAGEYKHAGRLSFPAETTVTRSASTAAVTAHSEADGMMANEPKLIDKTPFWPG